MRRTEWKRHALPVALLFLVQVLFRIPVYINPGMVNSDAAVVGLQARHILQGEWSWFLWGAGYQASFDSLMTAGAFALFGATPLALTLMPLLGHILMLLLAYAVLCKRLEPGIAWVLVLGLSWMPSCIEWSFYPPRQWSITALFAGIWLLDGAAEARRPLPRIAAAALLGMAAVYLDLYALQLMVGFGLFALLCAFDADARRSVALVRIGAFAGATAAAGLLLWWMLQSPETSAHKASLELGRLESNFWLLIETCLPRLVGMKAYIPGQNLYPDSWDPPLGFEVVQIAGALLFLGGLLWGGLLSMRRRVPWQLRRLGALGFVVSASSLGGFLFSIMPFDLWTTRYIAPVAVFAPFTLAPAAYVLGRRRMALGLLPYLLATATSAWLLYGPRVHGPLPAFDPLSSGQDEQRLCGVLRQLGVHHGAAQYWVAYRLTFLCEEDPIVVPLAALEERYAPYRQEYHSAPVLALIFHPSEPRAKPEEIEPQLRSRRAAWVRVEIAGYTVLIWDRRPQPGLSRP